MIHIATEAEIEDPDFLPIEPDPDLLWFEDKKIGVKARRVMVAARDEALRVWAERERRGLPGRDSWFATHSSG